MGVFPAASCKFLPPAWQELMLDHVRIHNTEFKHYFIEYKTFQKDSTVIDFYPSDFKIDLNGKKFAWQVCV